MLLCPGDFPSNTTGLCCLFLLQGILLTQGSNPHPPALAGGSLPLSHLGCPKAPSAFLTGGQFSVQSLSHVQLFASPWTPARQASLSNSRSPRKPTSVESVMPSNHLILCRPLLLPPSLSPSIRVFSNESALHIQWLKYWSFSFQQIFRTDFL